MKQSELYYGMARYISKHGFQYALGVDGGPRCFIGTRCSVANGYGNEDDFYNGELPEIVGNFGCASLKQRGWTKRDAIAACEMAGDIATVEEGDSRG